jgi:uncharacterized membrane protein YdjX (TVP38/TMEM64 family)
MPEAPDGQKQDSTRPARDTRSWLVVGVVVLVLVAIWRLTPLATLLDRRHLVELGHTLAASPSAPALVIGGYVVLGLVLFPVVPLLAATALVFDPGRALVLGFVGALTSAAVGYTVGRLVGRHRPRWVEGPRFEPLRARLRRRGVVTMAVSRVVPVGSFTLANVIAGAIGIRFRDFMVGNALGLLPGLLALTLLSHQLRALGWLS